jgi:hypothetical protein
VMLISILANLIGGTHRFIVHRRCCWGKSQRTICTVPDFDGRRQTTLLERPGPTDGGPI